MSNDSSSANSLLLKLGSEHFKKVGKEAKLESFKVMFAHSFFPSIANKEGIKMEERQDLEHNTFRELCNKSKNILSDSSLSEVYDWMSNNDAIFRINGMIKGGMYGTLSSWATLGAVGIYSIGSGNYWPLSVPVLTHIGSYIHEKMNERN